MRTILNLFGCSHENTTWPQTVKRDRKWPPEMRTYVVCFDCYKELDYDWSQMRIVTKSTLYSEPIDRERKLARVVDIGEVRRREA